MTQQLRAPAKLNLFLEVRGRRDDGYHEIYSCLHAIDLCDDVTVLPADAIELRMNSETGTGLDVPADESNLVWRAAVAFQRAVGTDRGARITLTKRIPAGAGLGGGSSNAAATLRLLNTAFGQPLGDKQLHATAASLGADVPFFLRGGTQMATGIGHELSPVADAPHFAFLLVLPPFGSSTAEVYRRWEPGATPRATPALERPEEWFNDLETPAMAAQPRLAALRDTLSRRGVGPVRMSGSGSTLFVPFADRAAAERARAELVDQSENGIGLVVAESADDRPPPAGSPDNDAGEGIR